MRKVTAEKTMTEKQMQPFHNKQNLLAKWRKYTAFHLVTLMATANSVLREIATSLGSGIPLGNLCRLICTD